MAYHTRNHQSHRRIPNQADSNLDVEIGQEVGVVLKVLNYIDYQHNIENVDITVGIGISTVEIDSGSIKHVGNDGLYVLNVDLPVGIGVTYRIHFHNRQIRNCAETWVIAVVIDDFRSEVRITPIPTPVLQ